MKPSTMDLEIPMALISKTLVCVFVGLQLDHVKKNSEVLSSISLVMLMILTLGHMIPLALDFEALCSTKPDETKFFFRRGDEWFGANEVIITVLMVVAFLMLLRLLHLTFSARSHDINKKSLWYAEEMTLLVIACLYAAGAKTTLLVAWEKRRSEAVLLLSSPGKNWYHPVCNDIQSYGGSLLDGFLLPQILLNMFSNSNRNALSCSFYIGTTFLRFLPRAYDLYWNHGYVLYNILRFSVNPDKGFFSAAWDIIMILGLLLFAAVIYLQQEFGGRCILPTKLGELETYPDQKLPIAIKSPSPEEP